MILKQNHENRLSGYYKYFDADDISEYWHLFQWYLVKFRDNKNSILTSFRQSLMHLKANTHICLSVSCKQHLYGR